MTRVLAVMCVALVAAQASAKPMMPPEPAPIARAISNVERTVKANPKSAQAHFVLGRLHLLKYGGQVEARLMENGSSPFLYFDDPARSAPPGTGPAQELNTAIAELRTAHKLDANDVRPTLSLAWALEERATTAKSAADRAESLAAYREVLKVTRLDEKHPSRGVGPDFDEEAAQGIIRLLGAAPDADSKKEIAELKAYLERTELAPRAVSPIVVLLDGAQSLTSEIDDRAHVHFDLTGLGRARTWPWPRATAALLVWDPDHCGRIRDGRQLFGNVTWWGVWRNGYEPLALLDDDGDGALRGDERAGLALWIDRNGDGVSDPGELVDLRAFGVTSLSTSADGLREGVAWQRAGVTLRDGRTLSTFDWTPTSTREERVSRR